MDQGSHPFLDCLNDAEQPMIIVGADVYKRDDGNALVKLLERVALRNNVMRDSWNGFCILARDSSTAGALDIGLGPLPHLKQQELYPKAKLVYLLGADDFPVNSIPEDAFVI